LVPVGVSIRASVPGELPPVASACPLPPLPALPPLPEVPPDPLLPAEAPEPPVPDPPVPDPPPGLESSPPQAVIEIIEAAMKQSAVVRIEAVYHEHGVAGSATSPHRLAGKLQAVE